mgnify:CR=1 FL=1
MKLLFIIREKATNFIEIQLYARSEKEAIAKAQKIAPRVDYCVDKIIQIEDTENKIGILEDLVDAIRNIEFSDNR